MQLMPYLNFNGQCEAAFKFYEQVLEGKIEAMMTYAGTPMESHVGQAEKMKIIHARMKIGNEILAGSDSPPGRYQMPQGISITLNIKDPAEADRVFHALAKNGKVLMDIQKTFWAARFGMCVDQFGIPWMINCDPAS